MCDHLQPPVTSAGWISLERELPKEGKEPTYVLGRWEDGDIRRCQIHKGTMECGFPAKGGYPIEWMPEPGKSVGRIPAPADRDTPGVFELWERDLAELRTNPASLDGIGACEPEQLAAMALPSLEVVGRIVLWLYDEWQAGRTGLVSNEARQVEGENADDWQQGMEPDRQGFANYLTFDLRQYLKA